MRFHLLCSAATVVLAAPAMAGDQVMYEAAPEWVDEVELSAGQRDTNSPVVFLDQQARIESGELWVYLSTAIALDSPQALTQFGTLSARWMPDKGDLIVHSVEILRQGETVDLLEAGAQFEVLRREKGLESRLLDGSLTATMNVPGARVGDIVTLTYSTTLNDQAMGENVQWATQLLAKPFPLEEGRVSVSWPEDLSVSRVHIGEVEIAEPVLKDGYFTWSKSLPIDELAELPGDSPFRFQIGEQLQLTTYGDWSDVSQQMAQHYDPAETITPGGELAQVIADIASRTDDPLTRAALALQIVQDDVSYLLNGLNGGNYLPQSPEETWENRYGDCKAKSFLLLAMLRELGVKSEVALVTISGGDALPILAPMPGNFDHMIVRADVDGTSYWLDGTSSGTRRANIDTVPRFSYALPLRAEGTGLMPLDVRAPSTPDQVTRITLDQSAGLTIPALFDIEVEYRGVTSAQWRSIADQADEDARDEAITNSVAAILGGVQVIDETLQYDPESGVATITARGVIETKWQRDRARFEFEPPAQVAKNVGFDADRARAKWREIPLRLNGPIHYTSDLKVLLPDNGEGFSVEGKTAVAETIGGVDLASDAELEDGTFSLSQRMRSVLEELPAQELSTARRGLARFIRSLPTLKSPTEIRESWDYFGEDRALLEPLEEAYAQAIADAKPDDSLPLVDRAAFRVGVYDFKGALEDVEAAYEIEASQPLYVFRAGLKREVGDLEGALEDYRTAEDLSPDGSTNWEQVELLALLGRAEEGLPIAEDYGAFVDDEVAEINLIANAQGWAGNIDTGLAMLEEMKARRPGDGSLLNAICWFAGIWNQMNAERLETCTQAVEKSEFSAAVLDSRALANLRLGNLADAKADAEAALLADPGLANSRLLRGIVLVALGQEREGQEEIDLALAMSPSMRATYEAWGLEF